VLLIGSIVCIVHTGLVCSSLFAQRTAGSPMLIVKVSSHYLHRHVISAGKFCWLASSKEPALFSKIKFMATDDECYYTLRIQV